VHLSRDSYRTVERNRVCVQFFFLFVFVDVRDVRIRH
jgi:hypothetical protein